MNDALSLLEASCKKLSIKVERLRAQLEAAETELAENQTAIRVLSRLPVAAGGNGQPDESKASSQEQVLKLLPAIEAEGMTPREIYGSLQEAGATISADNVRTILSRLRKEELIQTNAGRYWRLAEDDTDPFGLDDFDELPPLPVRKTVPDHDYDFDSEVPF
jgi:hypothetical protein